MEYNIKIGDYVETIDGEVGYIDKVCNSDYLRNRNLHLKVIRYKNGETQYITYRLKQNLAKHFKRIGEYDFATSKSQKPKIEPIEIILKYKKVQAHTVTINADVNSLEDGKYHYGDTTIIDGIEETSQINIINKINEIVTRLNELEE